MNSRNCHRIQTGMSKSSPSQHGSSWVLLLCAVGVLLPTVAPYGLDCSFPIVNQILKGCDSGTMFESPRQAVYDDYMDGCYKVYDSDFCNPEEDLRLAMNYRQPQSMINLTSTGYRKVRAPDALMKLLTDFWETNKDSMVEEEWNRGSIYTNHWKAPTYMVSVEDSNLEGGGADLKKAIWDVAVESVEEWTGGAKFRPSSLYGVRVYKEGAILSPHVDRIPLVTSAIVNVAQDVDEDWPLEVYDRFGNAVNVTMEPGDMVFYESHSLIHGRPFALKGRFYANIFIHFEPYDGFGEDSGNVTDGGLPPYILPGSPEEEVWKEDHPFGWSKAGDLSIVHQYVRDGRLDQFKELAALDTRALYFADEYGWQPLHWAVHAGHLDIVKYLVGNGADVIARTEDDSQLSPLDIAREFLGADHAVTTFLEESGAGDADIDDEDDDEEDELEDEYSEDHEEVLEGDEEDELEDEYSENHEEVLDSPTNGEDEDAGDNEDGVGLHSEL